MESEETKGTDAEEVDELSEMLSICECIQNWPYLPDMEKKQLKIALRAHFDKVKGHLDQKFEELLKNYTLPEKTYQLFKELLKELRLFLIGDTEWCNCGSKLSFYDLFYDADEG